MARSSEENNGREAKLYRLKRNWKKNSIKKLLTFKKLWHGKDKKMKKKKLRTREKGWKWLELTKQQEWKIKQVRSTMRGKHYYIAWSIVVNNGTEQVDGKHC